MTARFKLSTEVRLAYESRDRERLERLMLQIDELEQRAKREPWPPAMARLVDKEDECRCDPTRMTRTFIGSTDGAPLRCNDCGKTASFIAYTNPAPHAACGVGLQYAPPAPGPRPMAMVSMKPACTCGCPRAGMSFHEHDCPAR